MLNHHIINHRNVAKVRLMKGGDVFLPITSENKPAVPARTKIKWQGITDLTAKIVGVPSCLIMHLLSDRIVVDVSSHTEGSPYSAMEYEMLGQGLYCETVAGTRGVLNIPNALKDREWRNNPDVQLNMISYLGVPIQWPDGEVYGTMCVLHSKEYEYSDVHIELLRLLAHTVETDLAMLVQSEQFIQLNLETETVLRESHHRIKNHLNMLVGILQIKAMHHDDSPNGNNTLVAELSDRIRAVAELHSYIAQAEGNEVDVCNYLETIASSIIGSISLKNVELTVESDKIDISRGVFANVGLLVSELLTNSLKHAFDETDNPMIAISVKDVSEDKFALVFRDNGSGLPKALVPSECASLGMVLITDLPKQMGGAYLVTVDNGTTFEFVLKKNA